MTTENTRALADRHFNALATKDLEALRSLLHEDLAFKGPLATLDNSDAYLEGIQHVTGQITGIERRAVLASKDDVFQVYDVSFGATVIPASEWLQVRDGRIAKIEMFLDPSPLMQPAAAGH